MPVPPPTNPSPRTAVAQIGARRHYAVPRALHRAGLLDCLHTDFLARGAGWDLLRKALPEGIRPAALGRLLGRCVSEIPADRIVVYPEVKWGRALWASRSRRPGERLRVYATYNELFNRRVVAHGLGSADAVYVFNAAGREIAEHARRQGLRVIVDQTAAPWEVDEKLLAEERERWPGWEFEGTREKDWRPLAERERAEWRLADVIVCGSEYVVHALAAVGGPGARCVVVPYAAEVPPAPARRFDRGGPLRVLFAGTLQLRKGIQYVMEAARRCRPGAVVFRAVGPVAVSDEAVRELANVMEIVGPVPRVAMRREYEWADVLVLPSLSEGSANVTYEALANGLPVVTTREAGSAVRDGVEGYLVPPRAPEALAERLMELAARRHRLQDMSRAALVRAAEFTFERYVERLAAVVRGAGTI